jgi:hypothetical protein
MGHAAPLPTVARPGSLLVNETPLEIENRTDQTVLDGENDGKTVMQSFPFACPSYEE